MKTECAWSFVYFSGKTAVETVGMSREGFKAEVYKCSNVSKCHSRTNIDLIGLNDTNIENGRQVFNEDHH